MKRFFTIFMVFYLFPPDLGAQNLVEKELRASGYYEKGSNFRASQKDSSYYYLDRAFDLYYEIEAYSKAVEIAMEAMITSAHYYDLKGYRSYLHKIENLLHEEAITSALAPSGQLEFYKNRLMINEANYLYKLKNYSSARSKAMELRKKFVEKEITELDTYELTFLVYATHILAAIAMNTGKYDLAESYFQQALGFSEKNEIGKKRGLDRGTKRLLSQLYILMGRHEQADTYLTELLTKYKALYKDDKEYKNSLITVYQRMVNNLVQQDSLQKALGYLDESQQYLLDDDPFYKEALLLYGDIYLNLEQDQKALDHYQNALNFFKEYRNGKAHQDVAEVYGNIAGLYLRKGDFTAGLEALKKALNAAGADIQLSDRSDNPKPNQVFSKIQLLYLLDVKLLLLKSAYKQTGDNDYLQAALQTNRDVLETFDLLKMEFDSKLDKQFLAEKAYPVFHHMLELSHIAYKKQPSPQLVELALNITEKNKDFLLLEALRSANATKYGNVPAEVMDKEIHLRAKMAHLEKELFDTSETDEAFSDNLLQLKRQYYAFLDTIKIKYPKYHNLKYQSKILRLTTLRPLLAENRETLISYTMTDEYLYAIVLDGNQEKFLKLPFIEADREDIREFYSLLSSPSILNTEEEITALANRLYQKILKEPLNGFDAKNITVIPDGEIHYLPLDLLQKNGHPLLKTVNMRYGNSVTSLLELLAKESSHIENVLAFAPNFNEKTTAGNDRQFGKLLYNGEEVKKIDTFYDTETYIDETATLANFRTKAPKFNIIHLATHASANDEYPDYSYLAFSREADSITDNMLYIKDLYNTSLKADMVTLSACQTGIGKLREGQGMLSLSKGFYYAGAKSLVHTLWKINDKSSVQLMAYFYEGLSNGLGKSEALRAAKIKYLETTDDDLMKHPYYWSAFVVSGDISAISDTSKDWYWVAGLIILLLLFYLWKRGIMPWRIN